MPPAGHSAKAHVLPPNWSWIRAGAKNVACQQRGLRLGAAVGQGGSQQWGGLEGATARSTSSYPQLALPPLSQLSPDPTQRSRTHSAGHILLCRAPNPSRAEAHQNPTRDLKPTAWVWGLQLLPGQGDGLSGGEVCRAPWGISLCAVNKNAASSC